MSFFPVNLRLSGKQAVVVGGGPVAARKCRALLDAGAVVRVVAPQLSSDLATLVAEGKVWHTTRKYAVTDLDGALLVFAATSDRLVNRSIAEDAASRGLLVNVVDAPELCSFTLPSTFRQGDLLVAVSTGGKSPALARAICRDLASIFGPEYGQALELLGKLREKLLTASGDSAYNNKILNDLVAQDLPALFRTGATASIDHHLLRLFGPGFTLAALGVSQRDPL